MNKTYNIGAYGIPAEVCNAVGWLVIPRLKYTRHAMSEAIADRYGALPPSAFPQSFCAAGKWELVEAEVDAKGALVKFVVRRPVDATRSLVLVILVGGTVKTLWCNRTSDMHATLDRSKFATL